MGDSLHIALIMKMSDNKIVFKYNNALNTLLIIALMLFEYELKP